MKNGQTFGLYPTQADTNFYYIFKYCRLGVLQMHSQHSGERQVNLSRTQDIRPCCNSSWCAHAYDIETPRLKQKQRQYVCCHWTGACIANDLQQAGMHKFLNLRNFVLLLKVSPRGRTLHCHRSLFFSCFPWGGPGCSYKGGGAVRQLARVAVCVQRPEATALSCVCVRLYKSPRVPVTAHWPLAPHKNEAGRRVRGQESGRQFSPVMQWFFRNC